MSVTIRLSRIGKRHAPAYRVVAATTKSNRDGKFLDIIGFYNPSDSSTKFQYDKEKYTKWVSTGAIVSATVKELLDGKYTHIPYDRKKKTAEVKEAQA